MTLANVAGMICSRLIIFLHVKNVHVVCVLRCSVYTYTSLPVPISEYREPFLSWLTQGGLALDGFLFDDFKWLGIGWHGFLDGVELCLCELE